MAIRALIHAVQAEGGTCRLRWRHSRPPTLRTSRSGRNVRDRSANRRLIGLLAHELDRRPRWGLPPYRNPGRALDHLDLSQVVHGIERGLRLGHAVDQHQPARGKRSRSRGSRTSRTRRSPRPRSRRSRCAGRPPSTKALWVSSRLPRHHRRAQRQLLDGARGLSVVALLEGGSGGQLRPPRPPCRRSGEGPCRDPAWASGPGRGGAPWREARSRRGWRMATSWRLSASTGRWTGSPDRDDGGSREFPSKYVTAPRRRARRPSSTALKPADASLRHAPARLLPGRTANDGEARGPGGRHHVRDDGLHHRRQPRDPAVRRAARRAEHGGHDPGGGVRLRCSMGLYANRPIAVAPYMGENAFIAFGLAALGASAGSSGSAAVFVSGLCSSSSSPCCGVRTWLARGHLRRA